MKDSTLYKNSLDHNYLDRSILDLHHCEILRTLLQHFGIRSGDTVVEVGAGSGRYTELLLSLGLRVKASEPDPQLFTKLKARLEGHDKLEVYSLAVAEIDEIVGDARLLCGFHVLHHLNDAALSALSQLCARLRQQNKQFVGWFFLEPNPLNLLYPIQILLTPGMHLSEEQGIWRCDYQTLLQPGCVQSCCLGRIGVLPPRKYTNFLPRPLLYWRTKLQAGRSLTHLYSVYGSRFSESLAE